MKLFTVGRRVVKLISVFGAEYAAGPMLVEEEGPGWVRVEGDDHLRYHPETGREIDPVIPGCTSRLVLMDGQ